MPRPMMDGICHNTVLQYESMATTCVSCHTCHKLIQSHFLAQLSQSPGPGAFSGTMLHSFALLCRPDASHRLPTCFQDHMHGVSFNDRSLPQGVQDGKKGGRGEALSPAVRICLHTLLMY